MATKLKDMVAMLICDDTQESVRFYTEVLGFTVTDRMDNVGKTGWASLNHGDVQLMLASPDYIPKPRTGRSQTPYFLRPIATPLEALSEMLKRGSWKSLTGGQERPSGRCDGAAGD